MSHELEEVAHPEALALRGRGEGADAHGIVLGQRGNHRGFPVVYVSEDGDDRQIADAHGV
ncbi:MAG: hypothetical protein WDN28_28365 [Chthoniobacter sp.]